MTIQLYLQKNPASTDPCGPSRFSVCATAYGVQCIQYFPSTPKLTKEHVFPIKLGQLRLVVGENNEELR